MSNSIQPSAVPPNPLAGDTTPKPPNDAAPERPSDVQRCGLTAAETALLLGISESHLYDLLKEGRLGPEPRRMGRARRFDRDEVLAWFRAGCPNRARWQAMQQRGGR